MERTHGRLYIKHSRASGVPVPAALFAGIGAGTAAGLINVAVLLLIHAHVPPLRATFGSSVVAGALAGLVYAGWARISPRPVAALWLTTLLIATIDTVLLFVLPFPTSGRHLGLGAIAGITTPLLQILALFGIGHFGRGQMPASFLGLYAVVHYLCAVVVSVLIPVFVRFRAA